MNAQIATLAKLQDTELERARLGKELKAMPAEIADVERSLAAEQKRAAEAEAALKREDELRTKLEEEAARHRQKAARLRTQLDTVTTTAQAAAIEHEVEFAAKEVERLEGDEFASLERSETQEAARARAHSEVAEWTEGLKKTRERVAERTAEATAQMATLDGAIAGLRQEADAELLGRYDRIAASRGTGVARAENQQCTGCRMGVRLQVWTELREGLVRTCDSCGRLLYWDAAIAAAAKAPQVDPTTANGDGRAIRRPRPA